MTLYEWKRIYQKRYYRCGWALGTADDGSIALLDAYRKPKNVFAQIRRGAKKGDAMYVELLAILTASRLGVHDVS